MAGYKYFHLIKLDSDNSKAFKSRIWNFVWRL